MTNRSALALAAAIESRIQRCRPTFATPRGAMSAPITKPTAAMLRVKLKPANPASLSAGSLKVFRSSKSAVKVSAVKPPRWIATATMPRAASA